MSRLELPNGDWVDFVGRLNYAQARRIHGAKGTADQLGTLIAATVLDWALRDVDDEPIELPNVDVDGIPLDALDRVPFDIIQAMGLAASKVSVTETDPKARSGPSLGSRRASRSRSIRTLPTPTSSPITPDGPGAISNELPRASSG